MAGILGIEVGSSQLRLVRGELSGGSFKVLDFSLEEIVNPNPEEIARQLEAIVQRKKLRSLPAAVTLSGPGVVHRHLDLPAMPHNEMALVVERETTVGGGGEETVFSWEVIEGNEPAKIQQVRVLVAIAPRQQVEAAQQLLDRCSLKPVLFTTVPLVVLRALRFAGGEEKRSCIVLYVGGQQGYLLGVRGGVWNFYREFSSRTSEGPGDTLSYRTLLEEAVTEANRAVLYYRQQHRAGEELSFLLSGEKRLEELKARLEKETGIKGEIIQPGPRLDLTPLGQHAGMFRDFFPSFLIPLGLSAAAHVADGINLAPKTTRKPAARRPVFALPRMQVPLLGLGLAGALLIGYLLLAWVGRGHEKQLQERTQLRAQWLSAIAAAEESRSLRDHEKLLEQALGGNRLGEPQWANLMKTLSLLVEPEMALHAMSARKEDGKWVVILKGEVVSQDAYEAQAAFSRFFRGLRNSPYLERVELLPLTVTAVKERVETPAPRVARVATPESAGGAENPVLVVEVSKTKVRFEIKGQARES
jgi:Tfp pilus assembly PilM family ATPase